MKLSDIQDKLNYNVRVIDFNNVDKIIRLPDYEIENINKKINDLLKNATKMEEHHIDSTYTISIEKINSKVNELKKINANIVDIYCTDDDHVWYIRTKRNLTKKEIIKEAQNIIDHQYGNFISEYRNAIYIARISKDFREDFAKYNREEKLKRITK